MLNNFPGKAITRASDDRLSGARPIGQLSGSRVFRGAVGIGDKADFYSFRLSGRSSFNLVLNNLKNNVDVALIQNGQILARSARGGKKPEAIDTTLDAGTYFVSVSRKSGNSRYRLALNASLVSPPSNNPPGNNPPGNNPPGNPPGTNPPISEEGTFNNPINLGILSGGTTARTQDFASNSASKYYKFQLANISDVNFTLSRASAATSMKLYYDFNKNGLADSNERIETGGASPSSSNPISEALPATGTYFMEVNASSFNTSTLYDLVVATTPTPGNIPAEPGSDASTAHNLGTLNRGGRFELRDYIGRIDGLDYYRFDLSANANVSFNFQDIDTPEKDGYRIALYRDNNGNGLIDDGERVRSSISQGDQIALQTGANYYLSLQPTRTDYNISYIMTMAASA